MSFIYFIIAEVELMVATQLVHKNLAMLSEVVLCGLTFQCNLLKLLKIMLYGTHRITT